MEYSWSSIAAVEAKAPTTVVKYATEKESTSRDKLLAEEDGTAEAHATVKSNSVVEKKLHLKKAPPLQINRKKLTLTVCLCLPFS